MKRLLGWFLGFVTAGSLLGGCVAVVDPFPGVYAPPYLIAPSLRTAPACGAGRRVASGSRATTDLANCRRSR